MLKKWFITTACAILTVSAQASSDEYTPDYIDFQRRVDRFAILLNSAKVCENFGYIAGMGSVRGYGDDLVKEGVRMGFPAVTADQIVANAIDVQLATEQMRLQTMERAAFRAYWQERCDSLATDTEFRAYFYQKPDGQ